MNNALRAPFPWFGGKSRVAKQAWEAFGDVHNYVEPFAGSLAVLLGRPTPPGIETVNDKDGFICNAWRAIKYAPDEVARWAGWPVNECDLHARHVWLRERREALSRRLEGDPDYCDAKIAGWWLWGISSWIGHGWCDPAAAGPWGIMHDEEGYRQLVRLGNAGTGVNRQRAHLGNAGTGVNSLIDGSALHSWMQSLSQRLARTRVVCGDWKRVLGPAPTFHLGMTGVFLDPPYSHGERDANLYAEDDDCAAGVRDWAIANGDNPLLRIILCGYDTEHTMPDTWRMIPWKALGGYGSQGNGRGRDNASREVLWLSPHCLDNTRQCDMFM